MIFETNYRRKALDKWESERADLKKELKESFEQKKAMTKNPFVHVIASFFAWFSQQ